jgi:hypothetical protein
VDVDTGRLNDEARAQWLGYQATLVGLAEAGAPTDAARRRRRDAARAVLQEVDDLLTLAMTEAQQRMRQQLGRALTALGHGRLWPALYALTDYGPAGEVTAGDAEAFLAEDYDDVPVPAPPADWPGRWMSPPGSTPTGDDALIRGGLFLGAMVAFSAHSLGLGQARVPAPRVDLGDPEDDPMADAVEAWERALRRAAALPGESLRYGLAEFLRLERQDREWAPPAPDVAESGRSGRG